MTFSLLHVEIIPSSYRSSEGLHYLMRSVWSVAIIESLAGALKGRKKSTGTHVQLDRAPLKDSLVE